ncbi:MAG: polyprenyl synthetase family protein, partial [Chloroflexota bacterium]
MELPQVFLRYRQEIDSELKASLPQNHLPLYRMLRYHLGWEDEAGNPRAGGEGKRLRPTLCLLACEGVGGNPQHALPAAAAIELVHNFSLVHDDIQDGDTQRHGRPTVWALWGQGQALIAGSTMRLMADTTLHRLRERGFPASTILEASHLLEEGCLEMIAGQYLDISYEGQLDISLEAYLEMISYKTAALIATSFRLGALLGTADRQAIDAWGRCGQRMGLAFQIKDDILGIWGDENETGKASANDIRRRKKSLPIVFALNQKNAESSQELKRLYRQPTLTEEEVSWIFQLLGRMGARDFAQGLVADYCDQARAELSHLHLPEI